jgi:hypothetical protein
MQKMIYFVVLPLLFFVVLSLAARADLRDQRSKINESKLLHAIEMVENWKGRDGQDGEKGPYQITERLWHQYTLLDFTDENVREHGREVALCHLDWLHLQMKKHGIPETSFSYAVAWCAGWNALKTGIYSKAKEDYAKRVQNIYLSNP